MSIELEPLGTLTVEIDHQTVLRDTPQGGRLVGEATSARWEGERVRASMVGHAGHDWVRFHADGSVAVDARLVLRTDDGATIAMAYQGRADKAPADGGIILTAPTFETDDERYAWLNHVQAVGKGVRTGRTLVYELYALR
ncbi:Protein of unknown function [Pseudonocardia thermophila]|uniref:Uncharacterized protein n=1 Tax=Pseudonocardia thermophila TaxID=1848 RepID=A0A1M6XJJ3_PSETH|nr:DUF3237 domain-containing protein [Pseudonocardia thermophila]SHL06029.1 Protein of unknown function [Pseudonocardia thermophila]